MKTRFIIGIVVVLAGASQATQGHQQQPQQSHESGAKNVAPISAVVPGHEDQITAVIENGDTEEKNKNYLYRAFSADFLSNWFLVVIGFFGVYAALLTLGAIKRQADQMDKEFIATHRPKFVVREVRLEQTDKDKPIVINYVIFNAGSGEGQIVEFFFDAQHSPFGIIQPLRRDLNLKSPANSLSEIKPGAFIEQVYTSSPNITYGSFFPPEGMIDTRPEKFRFLFRGRLIYTDKSGIHRQTTFCRYYDFDAHRFRRLNDSDLEYED